MTKIKTNTLIDLPKALLLGAALTGCAHASPPSELLTARTAYHQAETSRAEQLTPASMHNARMALDRAERAYRDDGQSAKTRDMSYVAQRKAELAEVEATTISLEQTQQRQAADRQARDAQAARDTQGQLQKTQAQLATERDARKQAEAHTREALDKLAMASAVAVKDEPRGTVLTLPGNVLFGSGKSELLSGAQDRLNQIASALKDDSDHQILVEGHTDSQGSDTKNQELSKARAESVRQYLVSRGMDQERVRAEGLGSSRPVADNGTSQGRATNRRVEIVIEASEAK